MWCGDEIEMKSQVYTWVPYTPQILLRHLQAGRPHLDNTYKMQVHLGRGRPRYIGRPIWGWVRAQCSDWWFPFAISISRVKCYKIPSIADTGNAKGLTAPPARIPDFKNMVTIMSVRWHLLAIHIVSYVLMALRPYKKQGQS
jgi:hypothetical protein